MSSRLTINVFTPLPPSRTDIANVNLPIIGLLAESADVTVWTPQDYWEPLEDPRIKVRPFRADSVAFWEVNQAQVNIFHIGNNMEMHQDIFDIARRVPGLIVLHDGNLHDFMLQMYHAGRHATYFEVLTRCHGPAALGDAKHALAHGGMAAMMQRWSCALAPCLRATGILMHNATEAKALATETDIPVFALPLPFADRTWPRLPERRPAATPPYRLTIFGFLSKNRRVDSILRVLAASHMRNHFTLSIFGIYHDPAALAALITELKLDDIVTVHGYVSFAELNQAIAASDLVLNLRNPTVGEASGSQLRIWANGAASAVSEHGWYADLPADCCHMISPQYESGDLAHLLVDFCCRPDHYRKMGEAGLRHVRAVHDPVRYVEQLLVILEGERERQRDSLMRGLDRRFVTRERKDTLLADTATLALFGKVAHRETEVPAVEA